MPTIAYLGADIRGWLYTMLIADSTLNTAVSGRVYKDAWIPPVETAPYPCVLIQEQSPGEPEVLGGGGARVLANPLYLVKAVDFVDVNVTSETTLAAIATRIIAVLHQQVGGHGAARIISCVLEQEHYLLAPDDELNKNELQLGGLFRVQAQALDA